MYRQPPLPMESEPHRRRGSMLVELVVASIVLAVVMTVCMQLLAATSRQQRYADHRQLASEELANLMERITAEPYESIKQETLRTRKLGDTAATRLRDPQLDIAVEAVSDPRAGKKISLQLRWRDAGEVFAAPVRLTSWVYAPGGGRS